MNKIFLYFLLILSTFFFACGGDGGGGAGGGSGTGEGSVSSSTSLLSGAYSIDPNGEVGDVNYPCDPSQVTCADKSTDDEGNVDDIVSGMDPQDSDDGTGVPPQNGGGGGGGGPPLLFPLNSFSVCAMTIDGVIKVDPSTHVTTIEQGKKLENLFINIKVNDVTPEVFAYWRELGWLIDSREQIYIVPIILSGKIQYTKNIINSAQVEEDILFPAGFAPAVDDLPDEANTFLVFINEGNRYGYSRIPPQIGSFIESGTLAIWSQQLWISQTAKDNHEESSAGSNPVITQLKVQIPLRNEGGNDGGWKYQTVEFKNQSMAVNRVVWGADPSTYTPKDGCYDGFGFQDVLSLKRPNFGTQGKSMWTVPRWEVAP